MKRGLLLLVVLAVIGTIAWYSLVTKRTPKEEVPKEQPVAVSQYSPEFNRSIDTFLNSYYNLTEALVNWDSIAVTNTAQTMDQATPTVSIKRTTKAGLLSTSYFPPQQSPFYLWPQPKQAKKGKQELVGSDSTQSILVVDDDPNVLAMVTDILMFEGYNIETATNGAEALAKVDQTMPALVLLDMRMPVLSGWDFAHTLKERDIHVPILVMTAARDAQKWAEEIGASGYVAKPFHLPDLLDAVEAILTGEGGGSDQKN